MRRFGLIGYPLSHSFSQKYFTEKFAAENITDCAYENFPLKNVDELSELLITSDLNGFNITIPYKKQVLPFLTDSSEVVKQMAACNCVKIIDNKLYGYNTDVIGFEQSLQTSLKRHHNNALILGTGGAAAAVEFVLQKLGIGYKFVTRDNQGKPEQLSYKEVTEEVIKCHTLIINTTPSGMYPNINEAPEIAYHALTRNHYLFDVIYNPAMTLFLQKGKEKGATIINGEQMLVIQAEESWKIWNE